MPKTKDNEAQKSPADPRTRLSQKLKEASKISDSSANVYVRNIIRLHKKSGSKTSVLKPTWLTGKLLKSVDGDRHLLLAGVKLLHALDKKKGKRYETWYKAMIDSSNAYKDQRSKAKLSERETKKIGKTTFKDFTKTIRKLIPGIRRTLSKKPEDVSLKNILQIQEVLVLLFYTELPLRNELATVKISNINKKSENYLDKTKKSGYTLVLNAHKTQSKVGRRTHKISKSLARILNRFIPFLKHRGEHDFLLTSPRGKKMTTNGLSKYLNKITKKHFGTAFSSQIIRILYARDKVGGLKIAKEAAEALGHNNLEMTLSYAKK